jgi:hypothetical protein
MLSLSDGVNDFVREPGGNWWHLLPPSLRGEFDNDAFSAAHLTDELNAALAALESPDA